MASVVDGQILGDVKDHVCLVEFQKLGLPHAQCIFIMTPTSKVNFLDKTFIDRIISAIVSSVQDFHLCQIVIKQHIHSPCSYPKASAVCMIDKISRNTFQKTLSMMSATTERQRTLLIIKDLLLTAAKQFHERTAPQRKLQSWA